MDEIAISNYHWLPDPNIVDLFKNGTGREIDIIDNNHLFAPYYHALKTDLQYSVYLNTNGTNNVFLVNNTGHPVGWQIKVENGYIFFLPSPPQNCPPEKYLGILVDCVKKHYRIKNETPEPEWSKAIILPGEGELKTKIEEIQIKIDDAIRLKEEIESQKRELQQYRALLYENGKPLEFAVIKALQLLGFDARNYKEGDKEHDVILVSPEGRAIVEIEGKDNDSIHIGKLDQLGRVIIEDLEVQDQPAHGILIGNAFRLTPLDKRTAPPFTDKVKLAVDRNGYGLLSTTELFTVIINVLADPNNEEYKTKCRKIILETRGEEIHFK
jgi:hypothetical protein